MGTTRSRVVTWCLGLAAAAVFGRYLFVLTREGGGEDEPRAIPLGVELSAVDGVSIKRSLDVGGGGLSFSAGNPAELKAEKRPVADLIPYAYRVPVGGVRYETQLPQGVYDVSVGPIAGGDRSLPSLLSDAVERAFGITAHRQTRATDVFILTCNPGGARPPTLKDSNKLLPSVETKGDGSSHALRIQGQMEVLVERVSDMLAAPILDETKLTGLYDIDLSWNETPGGQSFAEALTKHGLVLTPAKRPLEVLVIRTARR